MSQIATAAGERATRSQTKLDYT